MFDVLLVSFLYYYNSGTAKNELGVFYTYLSDHSNKLS